jgi:beta-lactamase class D
MRKLLFVLLSLMCAVVQAETYFLLVDPESDEVVLEIGGAEGVSQRMTPRCSFNIALSLMGYDAGVLVDEENPVWAEFEENDEREQCRQSLNPRSWIANSCIWYSQSLTRRLGLERLQSYVDAFDYGNRDLSGGLTMAWLTSSLAISCEEQIQFLRRMLEGQLPVSEYALTMTRNILFIEDLGEGWSLFGKTGAGFERFEDGTYNRERALAWFVGWAEKGDRRFLFALRQTDLTGLPTMRERWEMAKGYLAQAGVLAE